MKLAWIEHFVALADEGSIRGAARARRVSQPVVTSSVRSLERELALPLVQRTARGASLTQFGHAFLVHARAIQNEATKASVSMSQLSSRQSAIALGASASAALKVLPSALVKFDQLQTGADVRVVECYPESSISTLREGSLDFLVGPRGTLGRLPDVAIEPLYSTEIKVICRKGHPLRRARTLAEIIGSTWIGAPSRGPGSTDTLVRACKQAGLPVPRVAIRCESQLATLGLVSSSDCLGLVIREVLQLPGIDQAVETLKLDERLNVTVCLFTRIDSPLSANAARLVDLVRSEARRHRPAADRLII